MKNYMIMRLFITFILTLTLAGAHAAGIPYVHTTPAAFLGSETVTLYVEFWDTDLEGDPGPLLFESAANGGAIGNPVEMTKDETQDDAWYVTFIPNEFYGTTVDIITAKVKNQAGDKETDEFTITPYDFTLVAGQAFTVYPASPNYGENVSLIFDLTACIDKNTSTPMTGTSPVYTWMWNNPEQLGDPPGQGGWGSIEQKAICVQIDGDIWRKDLAPQAYWETNKPMSEFGFLVRDQTGAIQTEDYTVSLLTPPGPVIPAKVAQFFPQVFTQKDIITVIYDTKIDTNEFMHGITECFIFTFVNDSASTNPLPNNWNTYPIDSLERVRMTSEGDGVWTIHYIPEDFYTLDPGDKIEKIYMIFWANRYGTKKSMESTLELECNN